jgi:hypothetical protein
LFAVLHAFAVICVSIERPPLLLAFDKKVVYLVWVQNSMQSMQRGSLCQYSDRRRHALQDR